MKRLVLFLAFALVAAPAFAQETGGGEGDIGFGGLFGMGDAPRGTNAPPPDRLVQLRKLLGDAGTPLTKDQESSLSKMLENEIKRYTADLEKRFPDEVAQARAASAARGFRGRAEGRGDGESRGNRGGRGPGLPPNSPLFAEMNRINAELQDKVTSSLKPDQQAAFKKFQNEQTKRAGGFGALKLNMQEAGIPLSADQETQIQSFYADEAQQRRQLMRESQGQPDKTKLDALTNGTMLKITKVLTAQQKKVLLESLKKQQ